MDEVNNFWTPDTKNRTSRGQIAPFTEALNGITFCEDEIAQITCPYHL